MSGRQKALDRLRAHEARRRAAWRPRISVEERAWLRGHEEQVVRGMNAVDRAVKSYRRLLEDEAA